MSRLCVRVAVLNLWAINALPTVLENAFYSWKLIIFIVFFSILRNCDISPGHLSTQYRVYWHETPLTKPVINFYKRHNLTQHFLIIDTVQKQTFTFWADRPAVWWCMRLWYVKTPLMCVSVSTHELQSTLVAPGDFDWAPSAGNTCAQVAASPARSPVIFEANWRVIIS